MGSSLFHDLKQSHIVNQSRSFAPFIEEFSKYHIDIFEVEAKSFLHAGMLMRVVS